MPTPVQVQLLGDYSGQRVASYGILKSQDWGRDDCVLHLVFDANELETIR